MEENVNKIGRNSRSSPSPVVSENITNSKIVENVVTENDIKLSKQINEDHPSNVHLKEQLEENVLQELLSPQAKSPKLSQVTGIRPLSRDAVISEQGVGLEKGSKVKSPSIIERLEKDINETDKILAKRYRKSEEVQIDVKLPPSRSSKSKDSKQVATPFDISLDLTNSPTSMLEKTHKSSNRLKQGDLVAVSKTAIVEGKIDEPRLEEQRLKLKCEAEREWKRMRLRAMLKWHEDCKNCERDWLRTTGDIFLEDMVKSCDRKFHKVAQEFDREAIEARQDVEEFARNLTERTSALFNDTEGAMLELWDKQRSDILAEWEEDRLTTFKAWEDESDKRQADMNAEFETLMQTLQRRWNIKFETFLNSWAEDMAEQVHNNKERFAIANEKRRDELRNLNKILMREWEEKKSSCFQEWGHDRAIKLAKHVETDWFKMKQGMFDDAKYAVERALREFEREQNNMAVVWDSQRSALASSQRRQSTDLSAEELNAWTESVDVLLNKWSNAGAGVVQARNKNATSDNDEVSREAASAFAKIYARERERIAIRTQDGAAEQVDWVRSHEIPDYIKAYSQALGNQNVQIPGQSNEDILRALITISNSSSTAPNPIEETLLANNSIYQSQQLNRSQTGNIDHEKLAALLKLLQTTSKLDPSALIDRVTGGNVKQDSSTSSLKYASTSSDSIAQSTSSGNILDKMAASKTAFNSTLIGDFSNTIIPKEQKGRITELWTPESSQSSLANTRKR